MAAATAKQKYNYYVCNLHAFKPLTGTVSNNNCLKKDNKLRMSALLYFYI